MKNPAPSILLLVVTACGHGAPEVDEPEVPEPVLAAPEVFHWTDCAIEFGPPVDWKRQRLQTSLEGARFVLARQPPGSLSIGHYRSLHSAHRVRSLASGRELSFEPAAPDFVLADVVDRVWFDPGSLPRPDEVVVRGEGERVLDGWPALEVEYAWQDRGHALLGREVYVVAGEALFVLKVQGLEVDLELFERLLATVRFHPDGAPLE